MWVFRRKAARIRVRFDSGFKAKDGTRYYRYKNCVAFVTEAAHQKLLFPAPLQDPRIFVFFDEGLQFAFLIARYSLAPDFRANTSPEGHRHFFVNQTEPASLNWGALFFWLSVKSH